MIILLVAGNAIGTVGDMPFFKATHLTPAFNNTAPQGIVTGAIAFIDNLIGSITGSNYSTSSQPTVSKELGDNMSQTNTGLLSNVAGIIYRWENLVAYFSSGLGVFGPVLYIFTSIVEMIQLVGIFIILGRIIGVARFALLGG